MAGNVGTGRRGADINVVPLIDIVLVLLIIFMVITPLIIKEMELSLPENVPPQPMATPPPSQSNQLVVSMNCRQKPANPSDQCADFDVYLGKDPIPETELEPKLKLLLEGRPEDQKVLFFDAENSVNYRAAIHVLDI